MPTVKFKVMQECYDCGKTFMVEYHNDGTYIYINEPCDCECDFSPVSGSPSISEWLDAVN